MNLYSAEAHQDRTSTLASEQRGCNTYRIGMGSALWALRLGLGCTRQLRPGGVLASRLVKLTWKEADLDIEERKSKREGKAIDIPDLVLLLLVLKKWPVHILLTCQCLAFWWWCSRSTRDRLSRGRRPAWPGCWAAAGQPRPSPPPPSPPPPGTTLSRVTSLSVFTKRKRLCYVYICLWWYTRTRLCVCVEN